MEVKKQEDDKEELKQNIQMPDVINMNLIDAKKILRDLNLEIEVIGENDDKSIITNQLPKKGIKIKEGTKITLYTN